MTIKKAFIIFPILILLGFLTYCDPREVVGDEELAFLNMHDTVGYVGIETCRSCHQNIYDTYIHTGMGQSFGPATRGRSDAFFDHHALVYDSVLNFYYKPFWEGDSLMVMEYRLDDGDTIHRRIEHISYIIGSGHHTNSHFISLDGYIYQAPITFYTQQDRWDLAPGYEDGFNSRFNRVIQLECMSCHNARSTLEPGSENKFLRVPHGIDCESCHGPGELHVREKLAGIRVNTSRYADRTIVNPSRLSIDLQMQLCQRCHLQGVSVLHEGRSFNDFRPGMQLRDIMDVFLPQYHGDRDRFIMASHAERLRLSPCFQVGELSCITCHNPHVSVRVGEVNRFNMACQGCHPGIEKDPFHIDLPRTEVEGLDCVHCHMPKSGSIDIPHVSITDHYIHIPGNTDHPVFTEHEVPAGLRFTGLAAMTTDQPSPHLMAQGYIRFFEGFSDNPVFLDSARYYLDQSTAPLRETFKTWVHLHYLRNNMPAIVDLSDRYDIRQVRDAYTLVRIGDAYLAQGNLGRATESFELAVRIMPRVFDFNNRLGTAYIRQGRIHDARLIFERIIEENPRYVPALSNLGIIYINLGETQRGERLLLQAISLNPDYDLAYFNLVDYYLFLNDRINARNMLRRLLRHQPGHVGAQERLREIG